MVNEFKKVPQTGKIVVIINGNGGVGKDTLCDFAAKKFKVQIISAITPIKEIAQKYGGWRGEKDSKSRKFLADLKELFVEYNDLPFQYLCNKYKEFLKSTDQILFAHIREGAEIDKFKKEISIPCYTLLITREGNDSICWGNASDDNVKKYQYDLIYENNKTLSESEEDFCNFLIENTQLVSKKTQADCPKNIITKFEFGERNFFKERRLKIE